MNISLDRSRRKRKEKRNDWIYFWSKLRVRCLFYRRLMEVMEQLYSNPYVSVSLLIQREKRLVDIREKRENSRLVPGPTNDRNELQGEIGLTNVSIVVQLVSIFVPDGGVDLVVIALLLIRCGHDSYN